MKIQIIDQGGRGSGIYGVDGSEIPAGTQLEVKEEPLAWAGRYTVLSGGDDKAKTPVTNPAEGPQGPFSVKDDGAGWHGVYAADGQKVKSLRKDDAEAFAGLSPEDQAEYLAQG